jgi:hypothetical protein
MWLRRVRRYLAFPARMVKVVSVVSLGSCTCAHGPPPDVGKDLGDVEGPLPDAAPFLKLARAIVDHSGAEGATPPPVAGGRRVVLSLWRAGSELSVATAKGATMAEAITVAAQVLASKGPTGGGRLELDVPIRASGADLSTDTTGPLTEVGLEGVLVARDDGKVAAVLPGEIVDRKLFKEGQGGAWLDRDKIRSLLSARAGVDGPALDAMRAYRFSSDAHVESARRDAVLPVFRGMVVRPAQADVPRLLDAVRRGADYLVRVMSREGRYIYMYHPLDDRDDRSYGWLRHAGTTYALLEAYEELGTSAYLEKAELALGYLRAHLHDDPDSQGKYVIDTHDEEQQKVGGAGISLVAFAKHAAVTGKRADLETMRALAMFILKQQYPDGHFRANIDLEKDGQKLKREVIYYAGEAILGLVRLYAIDPQPAYLDGARRAADWIIQVRDAPVSEENQEHDHWLSYALNDLYRVTHDDAYLQHAYKIARAIEKKQRGKDAPAPDLVGTFYSGITTPAATRLEALDADIALSRFAGKPDDWLMGPAKDAACMVLGQQFDADNAFWLPNPAKAEGGVRESLFVPDVEIDYVQHAMSAWLHLARLLRDPSYGASGVPSEDRVR